MLKSESASWKFKKQLCMLLQPFLLFECSRSWNPVDGTHSLLLLEKELFTSSSTSRPTLLSQSWSKLFKLQDFLSTSLFSDRSECLWTAVGKKFTSSFSVTSNWNLAFLSIINDNNKPQYISSSCDFVSNRNHRYFHCCCQYLEVLFMLFSTLKWW